VYNAVRSGDRAMAAQPVVHARESLSRRWSFEASGVRLHEWYFEQLDGQPAERAPAQSSVLMELMDESFGGFDSWLADLQKVAETRGVGWVVTVVDEPAKLLSNVWVDLHHLSVPAGQRVVYALDLWEHAYWTQFGSKGRKDYVQAVIESTDWRICEQRCMA
jgi:superoxide dismutase, Fe-Mn family